MSKSKIALAAILALSAGSTAIAEPYRGSVADCHGIQRNTETGSMPGQQTYVGHLFDSDIVTLGTRGIGFDSDANIRAKRCTVFVPKQR